MKASMTITLDDLKAKCVLAMSEIQKCYITSFRAWRFLTKCKSTVESYVLSLTSVLLISCWGIDRSTYFYFTNTQIVSIFVRSGFSAQKSQLFWKARHAIFTVLSTFFCVCIIFPQGIRSKYLQCLYRSGDILLLINLKGLPLGLRSSI